MSRPPRDANVDHLVTAKLVSFSYLQIGVFQALAGFYSFFVVCNDYGFDIFDVPGSAHYVGIIGTKPIFVYGGNQMNEKNDAGQISSFCPCGGEDGGAEISLNYADNMKYAVPIRNGQLDTSSSRYSNLIEHIKDTEKGVNTDAEAEAKINKYCPAYTNGNSKLPGGDVKLDESLGDDGKNWPYTWGCRFGAIEPTRECKFPDFKPKTGKNPCYKSSVPSRSIIDICLRPRPIGGSQINLKRPRKSHRSWCHPVTDRSRGTSNRRHWPPDDAFHGGQVSALPAPPRPSSNAPRRNAAPPSTIRKPSARSAGVRLTVRSLGLQKSSSLAP